MLSEFTFWNLFLNHRHQHNCLCLILFCDDLLHIKPVYFSMSSHFLNLELFWFIGCLWVFCYVGPTHFSLTAVLIYFLFDYVSSELWIFFVVSIVCSVMGHVCAPLSRNGRTHQLFFSFMVNWILLSLIFLHFYGNFWDNIIFFSFCIIFCSFFDDDI